MDDLERRSRPTLHAPGHQPGASTSCSTTSPASTSGRCAARAGDPAYRDYFHVFPDRDLPDAYERTLPEVFPDFAPGSFTWDDELDGWVWTTFNEWQWDLNWANPDVLARVRRDHAVAGQPRGRGAAAGRHRVPVEADGHRPARTSPRCTRSPRRCARVTRIAAPAVAFKAEAIVAPRDLVQYLGTGRHAGRVSDLAYHNSLMVQTWSMLATGNTILARHALGALPADAGDRHLDHLRPLPRRHRLGDRRRRRRTPSASPGRGTGTSSPTGTPGRSPGSWAAGAGLPGQPRHRRPADQRDRGLAGRAREAAPTPEHEAALARILLAHAIAAGWGGIPVIWSGDELGQPNDPDWAAEPGHEEDNRWAHRPRLDWTRAAARHDLRHRAGPGLHRAGAPGPGPRRPAAAARLRRHRPCSGHRRRRPRRGPPARERRLRRPLQRLRAAAGRSTCTGCARPASPRRTTPSVATSSRSAATASCGSRRTPRWWVVDAPQRQVP